MRILWVTAQILQFAGEELGYKPNGFGGWVMNMINELSGIEGMNLAVAMVSPKATSLVKKDNEKGIIAYIAPQVGVKGISDEDRDSIIEDYKPDIIHIEGNEYSIQNMFAKNNKCPSLVSLQGILSGYEPYEYGQLPIADYMFSIKKHNIISAWVLYFRKHLLFDKRLKLEEETIKSADYIMGRTFWDHAHSYWINPNSKYFSCNRILRPSFYTEEWNAENINKHSIFVGNGYSALKGLHFVIEAVALLAKKYPDVKLYVAGDCPIVKSKKLSLHKLGYSAYIKRLVKENQLEDRIVFTGPLQQQEMINTMKKSNVYVLPSLIENSPNTLGEAMMMGMPCVSAYTGGASEMAIDEKECLFYRANDPKLLAWQIKRIFDNPSLGIELGQNARSHAMITHNPQLNRDALVKAYKEICDDCSVREK